MQKPRGFTLIELLIVISIIAILGATIFVALDPAARFAQSRNARRLSEVNSIIDAVLQYQVDNKGSLPAGIDATTASFQILGTQALGCDAGCAGNQTVAACVDLSGVLVDKYLSAIPFDSSVGSAANTGYALNKTANGRIKVVSCGAELGESLSVQR